MTQKGLVVALDGNKAVVQVKRGGMCGESCASCKMCTVPQGRVEVKNDLGAKMGQQVEIEMGDGEVLKTAFLAYLLPAMLLVALLLVLSEAALVTWAKGLIVLGAAVLYFPYLRGLNRRFRGESRIIRILE